MALYSNIISTSKVFHSSLSQNTVWRRWLTIYWTNNLVQWSIHHSIICKHHCKHELILSIGLFQQYQTSVCLLKKILGPSFWENKRWRLGMWLISCKVFEKSQKSSTMHVCVHNADQVPGFHWVPKKLAEFNIWNHLTTPSLFTIRRKF